jgi:ankyrin repeat protein
MPLGFAALQDRTALVPLLLAAGIPSDSRTHPSNPTPLTTAAAHGNLEAVEALIDAGSRINGLLEEGAFVEGRCLGRGRRSHPAPA